jgi:acyl carrier protein
MPLLRRSTKADIVHGHWDHDHGPRAAETGSKGLARRDTLQGFEISFSQGDPMRDDIIASIRRMLVTDLFVELPEDQIGLDDGLQTVVGLDSIGFSELRILSERKFNVQISDEDFSPDNFSSVRRLATFIERIQAAAQKTAASAS